ncbi:MAG TPA: hypothetical protein VLX92_33725, partial [Kofleriaceae bacterium]|nr:hypothetical protein [Kofleriaceae bacterium]
LAAAKPREPGTWKPPSPPPKAATVRPIPSLAPARLERPAARAAVIAKVDVVPTLARVEPVEPPPEHGEPAAVHVEPAPVPPEPAPEPAPVEVEVSVDVEPIAVEPPVAPPVAVEAPSRVGAGMLHARSRRARRAELPMPAPGAPTGAPTFGASVLQARRGNRKLIAAVVVVTALAIGGLVYAKLAGSSPAPAAAAHDR